MAKPKVLALIPARGGSKGIKDKNIINLEGHPLIHYVIDAARQSRMVDTILCTTDSEAIQKVAIECGAQAPFLRPKELAEDSSAVYPALVHAVKTYEAQFAYRPDYVVLLQPTNPLIKPEHIDAAVEKAIEMQADSVITAMVLDHDCHPYNIREMDEDGRMRFWKDAEHYAFPTRQSKPLFYKFGNLFVTKYETLIEEGKLEGRANYAIPIDPKYAADINTPADLEHVAYLMRGEK